GPTQEVFYIVFAILEPWPPLTRSFSSYSMLPRALSSPFWPFSSPSPTSSSAFSRGSSTSSLTNMRGFVGNIEEETLKNDFFRNVLYTDERVQLVVMALRPGEDIGMEVHGLDQFIRVEQGQGRAILDGQEYNIQDGTAVIVPAGTNHNIVNTGQE